MGWNWLIFLSLFKLSRMVPEKPCKRVQIYGKWYDKEVILSNLARPYNLNLHKASNTLFFSSSMPDAYSDVDFQLAYLDIDTKEHQSIAGIRGGCTVAIDQINDDIFLGGSDGIYKYNTLTKLADFYKEKEKNIWSLFFKDNLFYISYPDQKLYIEIDGHFVKVREFENIEVDNFYVSNNLDIYFANKSGLFRFDHIMATIETLNELITVRHIVEDLDDILYIIANNGIYVYKENELAKVLDAKNIYSIVFDRNNQYIISDEKSIIALKPSDKSCLSDDVSW